jgi:hypothetical protein
LLFCTLVNKPKPVPRKENSKQGSFHN